MRKFTLLLCVVILCISPACRTPENKLANEKVGYTTVNNSPNANAIVKTGIKTGKSTDVITALNKDEGTVELDHEEIEGTLSMAKMKMMFYVKDKTMLKNLKVDDKVEFTLEENENSEEKVTAIHKK